MKYILFIVLVCMTSILFGQLAVDFTVTDSDGETHSLYADYLEQDQSVVLKVFFTTCPPCRSIAPDFQQLYEDWDSGNGDVEFIELSNQSFDHDSNIQSYKTEFGLTMPAVGVDGGSLDVVEDYTGGTFGPFTGTPLFIVISPDGTVNYGVSGSGTAGTISALHEAIQASREVITPDPPLFSGRFTYPHDGTFEEDIILYLEPLAGAPSDLVAHSLILSRNADNEYVLHSDQVDRSEFYSARLSYGQNLSVSAGLSVLDLIKIQRHILGLEVFTSPYQVSASDANFNTNVNVLDLLLIQKISIGLENSLGTENYIIMNECLRLSQPFLFSDLSDSTCPDEYVVFKLGDLNQF